MHSIKIPQHIAEHPYFLEAKSICEKLSHNGFEAYIVGGFTRDLLLNVITNVGSADIDIATSAPADMVRKIFSNSTYVGKAFGVCIVFSLRQNNKSFEVATFRQEGPYSNKRHPDFIHIGTIEEDSCRRDFSINALYYNPLNNTLLDYHNGIADLQNKIICTVGTAATRFSEDTLRIFRLFRFAANTNFTIEANTFTAVKAFAGDLRFLSLERIVAEITKINTNKFNKFCELFFSAFTLADVFNNLQTNNNLITNQYLFPGNFHKNYPVLSPLLYATNNTFTPTQCIHNMQIILKTWPCNKPEKKLCQVIIDLLNIQTYTYASNNFLAYLGTKIKSLPHMQASDFSFICNFIVTLLNESLSANPNFQHVINISKHIFSTNQTLSDIVEPIIKTANISNYNQELLKQVAQNNIQAADMGKFNNFITASAFLSAVNNTIFIPPNLDTISTFFGE